MKKTKYSNIKAARQNRLPVVAVDLDGTLLAHTHPPFFGDPVGGIVDELNKLRAAGWIIVVWTCRRDSKELREHLENYEIPYDYINESSFKFPDDSEKIQADVYLDDKAMSFNGDTTGLAEKIIHFRPWHK